MKTPIAIALAAAALAGISCSNTPKQEATKPPAQQPIPAPPKDTGHDEHALHNVHTLAGLISGGVPEGDPAFDELRAMGVKTIISVDGATPDLARAQARGMRYVHIPITYAEVPEKQKLEIARAIHDLPGPVYIHCHHGKHRSPAATAAAAVALGKATPDEAVAFMKTAGTASNYTGLYQCVAESSVASAMALTSASGEFPEIQKPQGMVAAMVEVDIAYENLGRVRTAGWDTPQDHPDLVPAAEAGRIADQLRFSSEDPRAKARGADYSARLANAIARASELEEGLVRGEADDRLETRWNLVATSCKDCHAVYRDKR